MSNKARKNKKIIETITKAAGYILLAAGIFLVSASIILNILQYSVSQDAVKDYKDYLTGPSVTFEKIDTASGNNSESELSDKHQKSEPVYTRANQPALKDELYILRIPKIDSENLVREGTTKSILADALGHEPGTAYIGEVGNCVIAGHRNYSFGKYFNRLNEVEIGDEIYVDTPEGTYTYIVTEIKEVTPDQVEVLNDTEDEQLTLYTCTPIYIATRRLVIIAKPAS